MANVVFSESAKRLAHALIAAMPPYDERTLPVVAIRWWSGVQDNRRGVNGEVIWEVTESSGWRCDVASWGVTPDNPIELSTVAIDGLRVLVLTPVKAAGGMLFIDAVDGEFNVEHQAI